MEPKDLQNEGRLERKKKEMRRKIVNVAVDLFQRQGFNNTTMEQIAEEADIARKTLYNYFPVKEAIVDEYVKGISTELSKEALQKIQNLPDTRARLLAALNQVYGWVEIHPELTKITLEYRLKNMFQESEESAGAPRTQALLTEIIEKGRQSGEIRRDVQVKLLVAQLDFLRGAVVFEWLKAPAKFELRKGMNKVVDLFMDGAVGREGELQK